MAFIIKIENPIITKVINSLEKMCSVVTFDFNEHGLGLNVADDNNAMAFSIFLNNGQFEEYEFIGEGTEHVTLNTSKLAKILSKMSYPFRIESTMDGSIKLVSDVGRQSYKQNLIDAPEKYHVKSEKIAEELARLVEDDSAIVATVLHQDLKEALRNVGIDSKNVTITLDNELIFEADSIEVEAVATAPLVEAVEGMWKMTYNIEFFENMLKIVDSNKPIILHLYPDGGSFVAEFGLENDEVSYYRFTLAPVRQRRVAVEEDVEEEAGDDDESESELD